MLARCMVSWRAACGHRSACATEILVCYLFVESGFHVLRGLRVVGQVPGCFDVIFAPKVIRLSSVGICPEYA